jgi:hypothetical protein
MNRTVSERAVEAASAERVRSGRPSESMQMGVRGGLALQSQVRQPGGVVFVYDNWAPWQRHRAR